MRQEVLLPQWGMGMTEGTVLRWLKQVDDHVTEDEEIAEIETAKVTAMLESPYTGTLVEIVAPDGETVDVRGVLAFIETAD
jgi:pyruvate/2-oxoglutarate dehydrogenase complex dihydrolipoamide acyltransferase (E2) component